MFIITNTMPISYNITKLIPTILDPNIHNPDADKLVYFCDSYNLTLTKEDTWIDQISSGYRCGKHLLKKQYYNTTTSNNNGDIESNHIYSNGETKTEDYNEYPTVSNIETPSSDEISFSIFTESGGNMTTITYPCFKIEEIFENNTLWTLNIGRAILCGIQTPFADSVILESKKQELEDQLNNSNDGKSGSNSNGNVVTSNAEGCVSTRSGTLFSGRANFNNRSIQTTKVIMILCLMIFYSIV